MKLNDYRRSLCFGSVVVLSTAALFIYKNHADTKTIVREETVPIAIVTNADGKMTAVVTIPIPPGATQSFVQIFHQTNARPETVTTAKTRVIVKMPDTPPPIPPRMVGTQVFTKETTTWSDYPPDFVIVPKDELPEGARRQWSTTVHENYTEIEWKGRTNRVSLESYKLTNHLMRIVKPVLEISEPVPAVATNVTNF